MFSLGFSYKADVIICVLLLCSFVRRISSTWRTRRGALRSQTAGNRKIPPLTPLLGIRCGELANAARGSGPVFRFETGREQVIIVNDKAFSSVM